MVVDCPDYFVHIDETVQHLELLQNLFDFVLPLTRDQLVPDQEVVAVVANYL